MATLVSAGPHQAVRPGLRVARRRSALTIIALLSPWIIGMLALVLYPMLASLFYSFTRYSFGPIAPQWIGIDNYLFLFQHDPNFMTALANTAVLAALSLPLRIGFALVIAMLLARPRRGNGVYRVLIYIPALLPAVATAVLFSFVLDPIHGPVNTALRAIGIEHPPLWLYDPAWSKPALVMMSLWAVGDTMLIFLAALVGVPRTLYEAVEIDGGGRWTKFRHVTLPMISPVTFFIVVTGVIGVLQAFDAAYVGTQTVAGPQAPLGAPQGSLLTYPLLQLSAFQSNHIGYASALSWVLVVITLVFSLVLTWSRRRWVHTSEGAE